MAIFQLLKKEQKSLLNYYTSIKLWFLFQPNSVNEVFGWNRYTFIVPIPAKHPVHMQNLKGVHVIIVGVQFLRCIAISSLMCLTYVVSRAPLGRECVVHRRETLPNINVPQSHLGILC